ncbi:C-reactive protein-like [Mantella aurantiaca]
MFVWVILFASWPRIFGQKDMGDNIFTFPTQSVTSYVRLLPDKLGPFKEATVCIRVKYSLALVTEYCLFSLASSINDNEFTLFFNKKTNDFFFSTNNKDKSFKLKSDPFQEWTSICVSWSSSTGNVIVWINEEKLNANDFQKGHVIAYDPIIIIGQDQEKYGGNFDAQQSFVGDIADVNMWDKVLSTGDIMDYINGDYIEGNVINWKAFRYELFGDVTISPAPCIPV